jgi:phage major head subunit gpT-like protein
MDISAAALDALFTGFKKNFQGGYDKYTPSWDRIATLVPSTTSKNTYPWLGDLPGLREWIGDRQIKKFGAHDYSIANKKFEQTVTVKKDVIDDDEFGIYAPMFTALGEAAAIWPDELVYAMLRAGFTSNCFDGQFFFDIDHPTYLADGSAGPVVSNMQAGAGEPWFLMNTKKALKPLIFQQRSAPKKLIGLDQDRDPNVFMRSEYIYGSDARGNSGYGFWQMAFGSKAALTEANFKLARTAMRSLKDELGRPIQNEPDLLVVGVGNADAAEDLLKKQQKTGGETNTLVKAVDMMVTPYVY